MKKASYGINVTIPKKQSEVLPHILLFLALPYLIGAKLQVFRYQEAVKILPTNAVLGSQLCLHEVSCLFEDLAAIARYLEMTNFHDESNNLWIMVRHHIRHDFREEFDVVESRKEKRAKAFNLGDELQVSIIFNTASVKIGEKMINISQINNYLIWAEDIITNILNKAKQQGMVKQQASIE